MTVIDDITSYCQRADSLAESTHSPNGRVMSLFKRDATKNLFDPIKEVSLIWTVSIAINVFDITESREKYKHETPNVWQLCSLYLMLLSLPFRHD